MIVCSSALALQKLRALLAQLSRRVAQLQTTLTTNQLLLQQQQQLDKR